MTNINDSAHHMMTHAWACCMAAKPLMETRLVNNQKKSERKAADVNKKDEHREKATYQEKTCHVPAQ